MKTKKIFLIAMVLAFFICVVALPLPGKKGKGECEVIEVPGIIYSDNDYGCGWENYANPTTIKNSYEIGVNLVKYAAGNSTTVHLMQIKHTGDFNPDPGTLRNLAAEVNAKAGIKAVFDGFAILGQTDLSKVNMLYMTGHFPFTLSPVEKNALKAYLDNGGFLFVDDCYNAVDSGGFEACFKALVIEMYGAPLKVLPPNHSVYSSFYKLGGNDFSFADRGNGTEWNQEPLEGLTGLMASAITAYVKFVPQSLNLKSMGNFVHVSLSLCGAYQVSQVDLKTVKLNGIVSPLLGQSKVLNKEIKLVFKRSEVHPEIGGAIKMTITGTLKNGTRFEGSDTIKVINPVKPGKK